MAGPLSPEARIKSLKNDFGTTRGTNSPTTFQIAVYEGHPEFGGVELNDTDCPGYARPVVANNSFAETDDGTGMEVVTAGIDATGAWTQIGNFLVLLNSADTSEAWDYTSIPPLRVREAGITDSLRFTVYYSDDSTEPS